jgi:uncharacterized membrane protein
MFFVFYLLDLIPGIYSSAPIRSGVTIDRVSWLASLLNVFLFALAFVGLLRRSVIAWKLGWVFLGVFFCEMLIFCMASTLKLRATERWVASIAVVIGCTAVAICWGLWWKRQKVYFLPRV